MMGIGVEGFVLEAFFLFWGEGGKVKVKVRVCEMCGFLVFLMGE